MEVCRRDAAKLAMCDGLVVEGLMNGCVLLQSRYTLFKCRLASKNLIYVASYATHPHAHNLEERLSLIGRKLYLLIGIAAPLPLMAIAVLLLNTSITSRVMATQRTNETLAQFL